MKTKKMIPKLSGSEDILDVGRQHVVICCDCGLAHSYFYKLKKIRGKLRIARLGFRDDYETAKARKK